MLRAKGSAQMGWWRSRRRLSDAYSIATSAWCAVRLLRHEYDGNKMLLIQIVSICSVWCSHWRLCNSVVRQYHSVALIMDECDRTLSCFGLLTLICIFLSCLVLVQVRLWFARGALSNTRRVSFVQIIPFWVYSSYGAWTWVWWINCTELCWRPAAVFRCTVCSADYGAGIGVIYSSASSFQHILAVGFNVLFKVVFIQFVPQLEALRYHDSYDRCRTSRRCML